MDAERQIHVMTLRRRVEQSRYDVDPRAVAAAIVDRMVRALPRCASAGGDERAPRRSGDVLEPG